MPRVGAIATPPLRLSKKGRDCGATARNLNEILGQLTLVRGLSREGLAKRGQINRRWHAACFFRFQ
jgi:hypothetical protein